MKSIDSLGEDYLIQKLQKFITSESGISSNEDAFFFIPHTNGNVINIDSMARTSDFLPGQSYFQIGMKLVTMTVSDIAAKGAKPIVFLSNLMLEKNMLESEFDELLNGISQGCTIYSCNYLGGDLGTSNETVLTGISIGEVEKSHFIPRNTAQSGDYVCVTGKWGLTGLGFTKIQDTREKFNDQLLSDQVKCAIYEPKARVKEGILLSNNNLATSCIDSSDGLAKSLYWLAKLSKIQIIIDKLPIHPILKESNYNREKIDYWTLYGGEEFELVFTLNKEYVERAKRIFEDNLSYFSIIGRCQAGNGVFYIKNNDKVRINDLGWDAYQST